jgi:chorismate dehydratase
LTWALDRSPHRWHIRYDVPSVCADLLRAGEIDLGLIPSTEYLNSDDYRLVPGVGIGSRGAVASVALFSRVPVGDIRRIAHPPDLAAMTRDADAALLIGDPALEADPAALGLRKIDLGEEWTAMTGLPFVYAAWTGRSGAVDADGIRALQEAQDEGARATEAIAAEYANGDAARASRAAAYLRHNVKYGLGADEAAGLQTFLDYAADLGMAPRRRALVFFQPGPGTVGEAG